MYEQEPVQEKPPKRKFWQNLLIMDSGDLKKILSLSSMMLSFALLFVYIAAYLLLMPLIDRIIGRGPVIIVNLAESLIPAIIATAAIMLTWPVFKDKRVLTAAYLWLILFSVLLGAGVLIALKGDADASRSFLYFFVWDIIPALIIGNIAAWSKYRKFIFK